MHCAMRTHYSGWFDNSANNQQSNQTLEMSPSEWFGLIYCRNFTYFPNEIKFPRMHFKVDKKKIPEIFNKLFDSIK